MFNLGYEREELNSCCWICKHTSMENAIFKAERDEGRYTTLGGSN